MKFFPRDWLADTRILSLEAKALWIDLICDLWEAPKRGRKTYTLEALARLAGVGTEYVDKLLRELSATGVADVEQPGADPIVTVICRRMVREEAARENTRDRVRHFRRHHQDENTTGEQPEAPADRKRSGNESVTGIFQKSDDRGQKAVHATRAMQRSLELPLSPQGQEVVDGWQALPEPFPKIRAMTPARHALLETRLTQPYFRDGWREALARLPKSGFYRGENARKWVANFDWLLRDGAILKLLEQTSAVDTKPEGGRFDHAF